MYVYIPSFLYVINVLCVFFLSYLFVMIKRYQNIMDLASPNSQESVSAHSEGTVFIKPH